MSRKQWSALVAGLVGLTMLAGCGSSNKPAWEIQVNAVGDTARKSVEVHLTGVEQDEVARWNNLSVTEYWRPGTEFGGNKLRSMAVAGNLVKVLHFGPGMEANQVYRDGSKDPNDPWNRWVAKAEGRPLFLVVLADLPGQFEENEDSRRLILPLDPRRWEGRPRIIRIEVQDFGLRAATKPKPERTKKRLLVL